MEVQSPFWTLEPGQVRPPLSGVGFVHNRVRFWVPRPQEFGWPVDVHSDHEDQDDQPPLTVSKFKRKRKIKQTKWLMWLIGFFYKSNLIFDRKEDGKFSQNQKHNFGRPANPLDRALFDIYSTSLYYVLISKESRKMIATRGGRRSSGSKQRTKRKKKLKRNVKRKELFIFFFLLDNNKRIKRIDIYISMERYYFWKKIGKEINRYETSYQEELWGINTIVARRIGQSEYENGRDSKRQLELPGTSKKE
jgi:hypothetical protein